MRSFRLGMKYVLYRTISDRPRCIKKAQQKYSLTPSQIWRAIVNGRLTISKIAKEVGVTSKTIIRWEKAGKIRKPKRDWKGWRIYMKEDLADIQHFVNSVYDPEMA